MPTRRLDLSDASRTRALVLLLLVALGTPGCGNVAGATSEAAGADPADPQTGAGAGNVVRLGDLSRTILLSGELRSDGGIEVVVPRLPSWETTVRYMVEDGSEVEAGQPLVELDTSSIAAELDNKLSEREQAVNALTAKEAEIAGQIAEKSFAVERTAAELRKAEIAAAVPEDLEQRKRYQELQLALQQARVAAEKAVVDLDGYRRSSAAEMAVAGIELDRADHELRQAREAIETMVLRAPRAGIAVVSQNRREDRKYQEGDTVSVGTTIVEIPDLNAMLIEARLSDVDDGKITPGMRVRAVLDAYPDIVYEGIIRAVSPVAQELGWRSMQRGFLVRVDLDTVDSTVMRPGMSARVEVAGAGAREARVAPRAALEFRDDRVFLRVAEGAPVEVILGPCSAFECVLVEGPPPGTRVVVP